jgi:hypothetical protein
MKYRIALLSVLLPAALAWGQSPTRAIDPPANRVNQYSKAFSPEILSPASDSKTLKPRPRNCTYLSPDRKTLSFKPCQSPANQPRPVDLLPKLFPERKQ